MPEYGGQRGNKGGGERRLKAVWKSKDQGASEKHMLVGKIMSSKVFNKRSVLATIRKGWNLGEETEIVEMDEDALLFSFQSDQEKHRFLRGRPWTIQGALMNIRPWNEFMVLKEADFSHTPIWVQFHNLPLGILDEEENILNMSSMVGKLLWYEKPKVRNKVLRSFIRARILVDIHAPLATGFWVDRPDSSEVWISIKYERLQAFCYKCGVIGHDFKSCGKPIATDGKGDRLFGAWLVANAEKDIDEAMEKFDMSWEEEDSREWKEARERASPQSERGSNRDMTMTPSEVAEGIESPMLQHIPISTDAIHLPALSPMKCDRVDSPMRQDNVGSLVIQTALTIGSQHQQDPRNVVGPGQGLEGNPPLSGPTSTRVLGLGSKTSNEPSKEVHSSETLVAERFGPRCEDPQGDVGQKPTGMGPISLHGPLVQLSPVSAVAQRIGDVTLKRAAEEPESPEPIKKRRLFVEVPNNCERSSSPVTGSKSVKDLKKGIRRRSKTKPIGAPPLIGEVDFPCEWKIRREVGGAEKDEGSRGKSVVSSGCTTIATKAE